MINIRDYHTDTLSLAFEQRAGEWEIDCITYASMAAEYLVIQPQIHFY